MLVEIFMPSLKLSKIDIENLASEIVHIFTRIWTKLRGI